MTTITIPKTIGENKNLIAIPRGIYEEFLTWQRKIKSSKTFKPPTAEKKSLARARKNFSEGNYLTLAQLEHELGTGR